MFLAYETQASESGVEDEQRVDGQANTVLDDPAAAKNANACGEGPADEEDVDGDARYPYNSNRGEEGGDDEWE